MFKRKEIIGDCTLYLGDCLEVMPTLKDVDLVLTDPPYGTTNCSWDSVIPFDKMWECLNHCVSPNTAVVLFGMEPFSSALRSSNINMFKYDWIWDKIKGTGFLNAQKQPMRNYEIISVFYEKQCKYYPIKTFGHDKKKAKRKTTKQCHIYNNTKNSPIYESTERFPKSILEFSADTQLESFHPTQKPVKLLQYLVQTYSKDTDNVLDFTMGSGTTLVACVKMGRKGIGIEIDEGYFDIACKRVEDAYKQPDMFGY